MNPKTLPFCCVLSLFLAAPVAADSGVWVAEGLTVRQIADDDVAPDCTCLTIDESGRVVVSGPGYIRMLRVDKDGNVASFRDLVTGLRHGAHGMCFRKGELFYTADNGIWKVTDTDSDGLVDSEPARVLEIKTGGEHDAHALRFGPDGNWYLICGNGTQGMFDLQNDPDRIKTPRAGAIWQISSDWGTRKVWAHGFRNAYDFDFAPGGAIDTYDSDGERDISLPWYRPTRVYRVFEGGDAGWVTRSWKRPNSDPLMPRVLSELGRGSPTGVVRNRNTRLPTRFNNGVFVLDWTFGRLVYVGDDGQSELIARGEGVQGFAVTDIEQTPDGRLLVSVGGRRSRGGVYLIDAVEPGESILQSVKWPKKTTSSLSGLARQIDRLRQSEDRIVDAKAARNAINALATSRSEDKKLAAISLLIESVGGLGQASTSDARGKQQVAAVFDGYRGVIRPRLPSDLLDGAVGILIRVLGDKNSSDELQHEAIRAIAVLEPESKTAWASVTKALQASKDPIGKLHHLIALARLPIRRSDEMTADIVDAMVTIPKAVDEQDLKVDRNFVQRLGELFVALRRRDSMVPTRLVTHPDFGHPSHLVWTDRMNPEGLEIARRRYLEGSDESIDADVARFIALGDDAVPRKYIRWWLKDESTRAAGWLAMASHPLESDVDELNLAALSFDKTVREAAVKALKDLGLNPPERKTDLESAERWMDKAADLVAADGDAAAGKKLFELRQCANCHNGAKALGPSLSGINKRFGPEDLLRATVDPNHTISDRYRAQQVVTTDGQVLVGMRIYQSVDGITLLTADAKTVRVNADEIEDFQPAKKSLMPEGLLDGLTDQQVTDLIAHMREL